MVRHRMAVIIAGELVLDLELRTWRHSPYALRGSWRGRATGIALTTTAYPDTASSPWVVSDQRRPFLQQATKRDSVEEAVIANPQRTSSTPAATVPRLV